MIYKKTQFLAFYQIEESNVIVNTLNKRVFRVSDEIYSMLLDEEEFFPECNSELKEFIECGVLIPTDFDEVQELEDRCILADNDLEWNSLHVIPTTKCNMGCEYCFVLKDMKGNNKPADLSIEDLHRAIDLFVKDNPSEKKALTFYGGEPFVNEEVIFDAVNYCNEKYQGLFQYKIVTNGTLITSKIADFLSENEFDVNVSLDGNKSAQDAFRVYKNKDSTYYDVVKSIDILKKSGNSVKVLITVGDFNLRNLRDNVESILQLNPTCIALNLPKKLQIEDNEIEHNIDTNGLCEKYFSCLEMCYEYGIPEAHFADILYGFLTDDIHYRPCSGCGKQIALTPFNTVGPCQAYLSTGKYFVDFSNINSKEQLRETAEFSIWKDITMFNRRKCRRCFLLPICPGDCPFDWENRSGSFDEPPELYCITRKAMFEYLIKRIVRRQQILFKGKKND